MSLTGNLQKGMSTYENNNQKAHFNFEDLSSVNEDKSHQNFSRPTSHSLASGSDAKTFHQSQSQYKDQNNPYQALSSITREGRAVSMFQASSNRGDYNLDQSLNNFNDKDRSGVSGSSMNSPSRGVQKPINPDEQIEREFHYKVQRSGEHVIYPYLVVNIGSGVSILKVTSAGKYERISGTSIGGGTYWGLCRLLTKCKTFDDVLDIADQGDSNTVDMTVGDIYGQGIEKLKLSSTVIASSFGKLTMNSSGIGNEKLHVKEEDLAKALLLMITNNIAQVAYLNAVIHKATHIYFVGNFLRHNKISCRRLAFAINYWSAGKMEALFLEHEGYFGALGAFLHSEEKTEESTTKDQDTNTAKNIKSQSSTSHPPILSPRARLLKEYSLMSTEPLKIDKEGITKPNQHRRGTSITIKNVTKSEPCSPQISIRRSHSADNLLNDDNGQISNLNIQTLSSHQSSLPHKSNKGNQTNNESEYRDQPINRQSIDSFSSGDENNFTFQTNE